MSHFRAALLKGVVYVKARKGFIATSFAVFFAMLLGLIALYAISLSIGTVNEEGRMTLQAERSIYPIAWSTANAVFQHLIDNDAGIPTSVTSNDIPPFIVSTDRVGVYVTGEVTGSKNGGVRVITGATRVDNIAKVIDNGVLSSDVVVRGFLSPDASVTPPGPPWTIIWR